ncbi:hypothetical protein AWB67_05426 [Caballeronia terrestris]|uniref:Uncharacterized protein n=1 Tax=Caballeronia terrestris TaxID=1226301 RepID=A0A158KFV8_9BURK|nr:hypothetical protein AWB67_05426 [Caballeronia terrestris]
MTPHTLRNWFSQLDDCATFAEIDALWQPTLEEAELRPLNFDGRLRDAMFSFLVRSKLSREIKLATVLGYISPFDLEPELAFGALDIRFESEQENDPRMLAGPEPTADTLGLSGCPPFLGGYIHGRYAEVQRRLIHSDRTLAKTRERFWNAYLDLCCRTCDVDGVDTALKNGAKVHGRRRAAQLRDVLHVAVSSSDLTERNADAVSRICRRLDMARGE